MIQQHDLNAKRHNCLNELTMQSRLMTDDENKNGKKSDWFRLNLTGPVKNFSRTLCQLTYITTLVIKNNNLERLPFELGNLINLVNLDASYNRLCTLPPTIGDLVELRALILNDNKIVNLPFEIGRLLNLRHLNLNDNPLSAEVNSLYADGSDQNVRRFPIHSFCKVDSAGKCTNFVDLKLITKSLSHQNIITNPHNVGEMKSDSSLIELDRGETSEASTDEEVFLPDPCLVTSSCGQSINRGLTKQLRYSPSNLVRMSGDFTFPSHTSPLLMYNKPRISLGEQFDRQYDPFSWDVSTSHQKFHHGVSGDEAEPSTSGLSTSRLDGVHSDHIPCSGCVAAKKKSYKTLLYPPSLSSHNHHELIRDIDDVISHHPYFGNFTFEHCKDNHLTGVDGFAWHTPVFMKLTPECFNWCSHVADISIPRFHPGIYAHCLSYIINQARPSFEHSLKQRLPWHIGRKSHGRTFTTYKQCNRSFSDTLDFRFTSTSSPIKNKNISRFNRDGPSINYSQFPAKSSSMSVSTLKSELRSFSLPKNHRTYASVAASAVGTQSNSNCSTLTNLSHQKQQIAPSTQNTFHDPQNDNTHMLNDTCGICTNFPSSTISSGSTKSTFSVASARVPVNNITWKSVQLRNCNSPRICSYRRSSYPQRQYPTYFCPLSHFPILVSTCSHMPVSCTQDLPCPDNLTTCLHCGSPNLFYCPPPTSMTYSDTFDACHECCRMKPASVNSDDVVPSVVVDLTGCDVSIFVERLPPLQGNFDDQMFPLHSTVTPCAKFNKTSKTSSEVNVNPSSANRVNGHRNNEGISDPYFAESLVEPVSPPPSYSDSMYQTFCDKFNFNLNHSTVCSQKCFPGLTSVPWANKNNIYSAKHYPCEFEYSTLLKRGYSCRLCDRCMHNFNKKSYEQCALAPQAVHFLNMGTESNFYPCNICFNLSTRNWNAPTHSCSSFVNDNVKTHNICRSDKVVFTSSTDKIHSIDFPFKSVFIPEPIRVPRSRDIFDALRVCLVPYSEIRNYVQSTPPPRQWRRLAEMSKDGFAFTLMCYNLLSPNYATPKMYPYCPSWALNWDYRRRAILDEIRVYHANIICLQELQTNQFEEVFKPELQKLNYDGVFLPKSRRRTMEIKDSRKVDGCAIFWQTDKFEKLFEFHHEFMLSCTSMCEKPTPLMLNRVMARDNVALGVIFETKGGTVDNTGGRQFCVTTGHIHWDPEHSDVKMIQTILWTTELWAYIDGFLTGAGNLNSKSSPTLSRSAPLSSRISVPGPSSPAAGMPVILCGDLNSLPDSGVVEFLMKSNLSLAHDDFLNNGFKYMFEEWRLLEKWALDGNKLRHRFDFDRAYRDYQGMNLTNFTYDFKGMIDYVLFTRQHFRILGSLDQIHESWFQEKKILGCPHVHIPSDHFSLLVELELKPTPQLAPYIARTTRNCCPSDDADISETHGSRGKNILPNTGPESLMSLSKDRSACLSGLNGLPIGPTTMSGNTVSVNGKHRKR